MKVAALQTVSTPRLPDNLDAAARLLTQAAHAGAELAVLPEYFCLMGQRDTDKLAIAEAFGDGPIQQWLATQARTLGLWIVGGTLPLRLESEGAPRPATRVHNSVLAFSPQGECVARYDKIHLFRFHDGERHYDEAAVLQAGRTPVQFTLPARDGHAWRIGLSVCYDLRFPELYRAYAAQGADLLLVPSAFTYVTGQAHWEVLLRARAIENLCAVVAPAQGGTHENGRRTWGRSMVVDAWGQVLALHAEGPGLAVAELDAAAQAARRASLPALGHRVL
ncbi:carbon-nitrogen hydrolase family protein [Comamonadaceae bacterium OH2545_COT-014]|nr:carbon-nitrogen hydrolase family protein [Comamonadaceae bacterium OH2545_COT-014]